MKKIFVFLLALSLLILCGCGGGDKTCTHADANTDGICDSCQEKIGECTHADENSDSKCDKCDTALTPATNLALVTDGVANFQFVITSSCREAKNVVYEQIDVINAHLAKDATMVNDVSGNEQALEIIIGAPVNRDAKYYVDEHYLGHKGYCIKVVDSKVLVLAGSAEMYSKAMEILVEDILGIGNRTGRLKNVSISTDTVYEKLTTDYPVESVTIAGTAIGEFVLAIDTNEFYTTGIAYELQPMLYRYLGVWLDIVDFEDLKEGQKAISFSIFENNDENKELEDYRMHVNEDGDLVFETKFPAKFSDCVTDYFSSSVIGSGKKKVVISATTERTKNLKDIYYSDKEFGAVGDGITDDFMAIKKCHDYANEWGHTVHATAGKTYYFGVGSGINTIEIKTDTYWHGAKFIFDDRSVVPYSDEYSTPIFTIAPDGKSKTYTGANLPFTSVYQGDTKVEWAPGVRTLIVLQSSDVRHFIRYGDNEDNGSAQTELLVIRPDGTIDPSTPVQWDYANITRIQAYPCDDKPITVSGGSPGGDVEERALVETLFNGAPSKYTYYKRNIQIERSNVLLTNIEHITTGDDTSPTGAPYSGFTSVSTCENVVLNNLILERHKGFNTTGSANTSVGMGTYEMSARYSNNITWQNITQPNFFEEDGSVKYHGMMGTNYCKNLTFDNVFTCSFDAHCGTYNATIKNSTCEHLNFIGEGTIRLENVTIYTDGSNAAMIFRTDYGSTWEGKVIIDGLTLKTSKSNPTLTLIKTQWTNHYFGYQTYLPEKIEMNDVKIVKYTYGVDSSGERWEDIDESKENFVALNIYSFLNNYKTVDLSDPNADMSAYPNDYGVCKCEQLYAEALAAGTANVTEVLTFHDTDGDGRCNNKRIDKNGTDANATYKQSSVWCWGFNGAADTSINANPTIPTKEIYVTNCGDLRIVVPPTDQFDETELYIDGELQDRY